jgi:hypothetical protein
MSHADVYYVFGRFRIVREAYGIFRRLADKVQPKRERPATTPSDTVFPGLEIEQVVQTVREDAVFVGLHLPERIVAEIKAFAQAEPLHAIYDRTGPTFHYADVVNGVAPDGRLIPVAGVADPARCPAIQTIIDDPNMREVVRRYLGHEPTKVVTLLSWSIHSPITDDERRRLRHHVIDYHYDTEGFNFVFVSFYITDTDRNSGAHVMMKRSHNKKPLRMLLGSVRAAEADVYKVFGRENEITIEGPAGLGFVQDTSCYHRATSPISGDRLMLAIRFIN